MVTNEYVANTRKEINRFQDFCIQHYIPILSHYYIIKRAKLHLDSEEDFWKKEEKFDKGLEKFKKQYFH